MEMIMSHLAVGVSIPISFCIPFPYQYLELILILKIVPNQPSSDLINAYLNTGKLPAARKEKLVSVYTAGQQRGPIPDPYQVPTGAEAGDADSA